MYQTLLSFVMFLDTASRWSKVVEADFIEVAYIDSTALAFFSGAAHRAQEWSLCLLLQILSEKRERVLRLGADKDLNVRSRFRTCGPLM